MMSNAAMLWTGGKDSSLALYEAKLLGYEVKSLVTFVPPGPEFLAHPISFMKYQAEAIGLPHYTLEVNEPFKASYESAIHSLRERHGIDILITGDIAEITADIPNVNSEVKNYPNWIIECSKYSDVKVLTPLWGIDRSKLIDRLLSYKFKVIFSLVKKPWFTIGWLGKEIDRNSLEELQNLSMKTELDVCGEQGEYHTLVLDGPLFKRSISIDKYSKEIKGSLIYIDIQKVSLKNK
ncbi:hypothetical protein CMO93_04165 [Candidatus Woesearchaeota archaeon]|nr:hypothetical protein [Candidatus Woesearchaeota archaeon]|tara:strand:- start:95 stop:802 length:708 start_codon:yes stop_codon:yes gene_type:complete